MKNPFPASDADRHAIWEMLVERDIDAFVAADWSLVADDFDEESFFSLNAGNRANPDTWSLAFADLSAYRAEWLRQAERFRCTVAAENPARDLHALTFLRDIEVSGDRALAHKKFDGWLQERSGSRTRLCWQTLYHCRRIRGVWKIVGFSGYLPMALSGGPMPAASPPKQLPAGASQHTTAGPYSPVLQISPGKLIVISGQAALDHSGQVVGESIEEQTRLTLENCFKQLASAGCAPADVFKVNVFMTDLAEWPRLNAVYREMFPEPRPVRTAVQTGLLSNLKVEIEMWAVTA